MLDIETTTLLRAIHAEVCESISGYEIYTRTHVASKLLEAASSGERSILDLKKIGRSALKQAAMTRRVESWPQ